MAKVQGGGADLQRRRTDKGGEISVLKQRWGFRASKSIAESVSTRISATKSPPIRADVLGPHALEEG